VLSVRFRSIGLQTPYSDKSQKEIIDLALIHLLKSQPVT